MDTDLPSSIYLLVFCLVLSGIFSASETSITATGRGKLLAIREKRPAGRARAISWLIEDIHRALTVTLIGNNLVNIAASAVATSIAVYFFGDKGLPIAILLMTFIILIFGEILPKTLAITHAEKAVVFFLPFLRFVWLILSPLVWLVTLITKILGKMVHLDLSLQRAFITREDIEEMLKIGEESGAIEDDERRMIKGIISFEDTRAYQVMVPRMDMVAIPDTTTVGGSIETFRQYGHSRVPVYEGDIDHIKGILYVKDIIMPLYNGNYDDAVINYIREALFVPESIKISDLFDIMRSKRVHMAILVDEYGGTAGLITMEDLLEEIVGEIQDEYDTEVPPIYKESEGIYIVDGLVNLEDLSEYLDYPFECEDADSVAGFVLSHFGRFPVPRESFIYGEWNIEVMEVDQHRVKRLRFSKVHIPSNESERDEYQEDRDA